jgi:hypothetical protein
MANQNMPNTGWAMHTRKGKRHTVPRTAGVYVDFDDPRSDRRWRVRLLDVSEGGLSFPTVDNSPALKKGDVLQRAVIHSGGWKIVGDLEVTYTTHATDQPHVCGASFEPRSESDGVKLKTMISAMNAATDGDECDGLCPESLEAQV